MRNFILGLVVIMLWNLSGVRAAGEEKHASHQTEQPQSSSSQTPSEQNMSGTMASMGGPSNSLADVLQNHTTSGTDAEPASTAIEMLMATRGKWTLMFHGEAFLNEVQQSGARGSGKLFSTNWFMPMAQRRLGRGTLTLRTMLSLEPATISKQRYPELFQQGETAFGKAIVDGQHPHDFIMEVAAIYDYKVGAHTLLSLYAAPWVILPWGRSRIRTGNLPRRIRSLPSATTCKTRRTLLTM